MSKRLTSNAGDSRYGSRPDMRSCLTEFATDSTLTGIGMKVPAPSAASAYFGSAMNRTRIWGRFKRVITANATPLDLPGGNSMPVTKTSVRAAASSASHAAKGSGKVAISCPSVRSRAANSSENSVSSWTTTMRAGTGNPLLLMSRRSACRS